MKTTHLEYLEDTYKHTSTGTTVETGSHDFGEYIILDSTIFYPQGGGQPTDIGIISSGENQFEVENVRLDENGIVFHYGKYKQSIHFSQDTTVLLQVDGEIRMQNAMNHTAGHLIDLAVKNIGWKIAPSKGFHFNSGPYVEYLGSIENINEGTHKQEYIAELNTEISRLIGKDVPIIITNSNINSTQKNTPVGKIYRYVYFDGYEEYGCGCGGTHLQSTGEFGNITISKIRVKKGNTKISYTVSQ